MTIKHLKIFLEVYKYENVTKAAETLGMTQPAVSRAIKEIEDEYEIKLFDRMNRKLIPTDVCRDFYPKAIHVVDSFEGIGDGLRNPNEKALIRLGASMMLGTMLCPQLVEEYNKTHPNVEVRVKITNRSVLRDKLLKNELDMVLMEDKIASEDLIMEAFSEDRLTLIFPVGHPLGEMSVIRLSDVVKFPLLLREKGSASRTLVDSVFTSHGITFTPSWESLGTEALVRAVRKNLGVSILPEPLVHRAISEHLVETAPISDAGLTRRNYIVWHKNKFITEHMRELIELCKTCK